VCETKLSGKNWGSVDGRAAGIAAGAVKEKQFLLGCNNCLLNLIVIN